MCLRFDMCIYSLNVLNVSNSERSPSFYLMEAWEMCSLDGGVDEFEDGSIKGRAIANLLRLALMASRAAYKINAAADEDASKEMRTAIQAIGEDYQEGKGLYEEMIRCANLFGTHTGTNPTAEWANWRRVATRMDTESPRQPQCLDLVSRTLQYLRVVMLLPHPRDSQACRLGTLLVLVTRWIRRCRLLAHCLRPPSWLPSWRSPPPVPQASSESVALRARVCTLRWPSCMQHLGASRSPVTVLVSPLRQPQRPRRPPCLCRPIHLVPNAFAYPLRRPRCLPSSRLLRNVLVFSLRHAFLPRRDSHPLSPCFGHLALASNHLVPSKRIPGPSA